MNDLVKQAEKESAFNRIMRFMDDGDITLQSKEELILHRWNHAYKLFIQKKYTREQIAEKVSERFDVSIYTARNDYYQALALYAGLMHANKKLLLDHHAENLRLMMERFSQDKTLVHLVPKLAAEYTRAVIAIPEEISKDKIPPPQMIFYMIPGQEISSKKGFEEALANIKKRQSQEGKVTDIDYEDLNGK
jgi:hypothetical protein